MAEKRVFVTVGTTSFDELVAAATENRFMEVGLSCDLYVITLTCPNILSEINYLVYRTPLCSHCVSLPLFPSLPLSSQLLVNKGYTHLTLQIGRGSYEPPTPPKVAGIQLEFYRFKSSLQEDMQKASLILSHGGKGEKIMKHTCVHLVISCVFT